MESLFSWATCTVCKVLHGWSRGQKNEQQNNTPNPKKNNATAGYQGPVITEFLKGSGLLVFFFSRSQLAISLVDQKTCVMALRWHKKKENFVQMKQ